jgi:hypothetical protein
VVDYRGIPCHRVGNPPGIPRSRRPQHAAEPVRSTAEHEGLKLQNSVEEPQRRQDQSTRSLKVPRLSRVIGGAPWTSVQRGPARCSFSDPHPLFLGTSLSEAITTIRSSGAQLRVRADRQEIVPERSTKEISPIRCCDAASGVTFPIAKLMLYTLTRTASSRMVPATRRRPRP